MQWQTGERHVMSRRLALRWLGGLALGLSAAACTPVRIAFRMYPKDFDEDPELVDAVLRGFVTAVVPGMPEDAPHLTRVFYDDFYRVGKYRSYLAADLCERAERRYGWPRFEALPAKDRCRVIEDALQEGGVTQRLYVAAVFLAQLASYAGPFDDEQGCPLIGFEGRFRMRPLAELSYPDPERFLPRALTADGNPA